MKSLINNIQKREKGQIIVILALIFIGLVAIIGLAVDSGYLYVSYSRLRRAVDAAALGATTQFKKNVQADWLDKSAREFLVLNGVPDTASLAASVETCSTNPGDPALCTTPPRKLVRVTAHEDVPLFFLSIIGLHTAPIDVTSISEAAAVDLVLVIDRSESMGELKDNGDGTFSKFPVPSANLDPVSCNSSHPSSAPDGNPGLWTGNCHPFQEVKSAAWNFVDTFMDIKYDKVAIVVFDNKATAVNFGPDAAHPIWLSGDRDQILAAIRDLWMYDGFHDSGGGQDQRLPNVYGDALNGMKCPYFSSPDPALTVGVPPCRMFNTTDHDKYHRIDCAGYYSTPLDLANCGSTNIGGGINYASAILSAQGRKEGALWVTILLTDGVPNAGYDTPSNPSDTSNPICPAYARVRFPGCRDTDALVRHTEAQTSLYDTDDYARDEADKLADGSLIFSVGLGDKVTVDSYADAGTPPAGITLLNYIAKRGDTNNYYQADINNLQRIFLAIANKIATRLNQ